MKRGATEHDEKTRTTKRTKHQLDFRLKTTPPTKRWNGYLLVTRSKYEVIEYDVWLRIRDRHVFVEARTQETLNLVFVESVSHPNAFREATSHARHELKERMKDLDAVLIDAKRLAENEDRTPEQDRQLDRTLAVADLHHKRMEELRSREFQCITVAKHTRVELKAGIATKLFGEPWVWCPAQDTLIHKTVVTRNLEVSFAQLYRFKKMQPLIQCYDALQQQWSRVTCPPQLHGVELLGVCSPRDGLIVGIVEKYANPDLPRCVQLGPGVQLMVTKCPFESWHPCLSAFNGCMFMDGAWCFDPSTRAWSKIPLLNHPRDDLSTIAFDGCLFAVGGENKEQLSKRVERYDGERWYNAAPLTKPRHWSKLVVFQGKLYAFGGERFIEDEDDGDDFVISSEVYSEGKWSSGPQFTRSSFHSVVVIAGSLVAFDINGKAHQLLGPELDISASLTCDTDLLRTMQVAVYKR